MGEVIPIATKEDIQQELEKLHIALSNSFDKNAIEVRNSDGVKLGFVPQKDNVVFSRLMDAGKLLYGVILSKELVGRWLKLQMEIYLQDL